MFFTKKKLGVLFVLSAIPLQAKELIYDELGRLKRVEYDDDAIMEYKYDPRDNRKQTISQKAPTNDPPIAVDDNFSVSEDSTRDLKILDNDSDPNGNSITLIELGTPSHGSVQIVEDRLARYTPNTNFVGVDTFSYVIADPNGANATANVRVSVTQVNDKPIARNDSYTINEDTATAFAVINNDSDIDGDSLKVSSATKPKYGTTSITHNGSRVTYTPSGNYNGSDAFNYTISDGNGGTDSAIVNITVKAVNDPPIARNDSYNTYKNQASVLNVVSNDSDVDGTFSIYSFTTPSKGRAVLSSNKKQFTYTPNHNVTGSDSFTYKIRDDKGATSQATVTVTILPKNYPPVAINDQYTIGKNITYNLPVLNNDSDPDGDALSISSTSSGSWITSGGKKVGYRNGQVGFVTLTYTISDGNGGTATASIGIHIVDAYIPPF